MDCLCCTHNYCHSHALNLDQLSKGYTRRFSSLLGQRYLMTSLIPRRAGTRDFCKLERLLKTLCEDRIMISIDIKPCHTRCESWLDLSMTNI